MKTLKTLCLVCLAVLTFSCNKDDDSSETPQTTNLELLTSGKWYQESRTPGTYSTCEKSTYLLFISDGTLKLESFDENSGNCQSNGVLSGTYTLTNNTALKLIFGEDSINAIINSISENELTIKTDQNETLVFDKTEG